MSHRPTQKHLGRTFADAEREADDFAAPDWWLNSPTPDEGEEYAANEVASHQAMNIREERT